ncbi:MAG: MFS transporter, partial [Acidobacteriota bacterium]|nr:MFS transporter [Acidobacteriota bacterium]
AQIGVKLYHQTGDMGEGAMCTHCGQRFASRMHVEDLRQVLPQLGFDFGIAGPAGHWQALCPACKRKSLARAQIRLKEAARG